MIQTPNYTVFEDSSLTHANNTANKPRNNNTQKSLYLKMKLVLGNEFEMHGYTQKMFNNTKGGKKRGGEEGKNNTEGISKWYANNM